MDAPRRLVRAVLAWPVESQQGSRRNALVATTALTQLRHEREEVEAFLEAVQRRSAPRRAQESQTHRDVI